MGGSVSQVCTFTQSFISNLYLKLYFLISDGLKFIKCHILIFLVKRACLYEDVAQGCKVSVPWLGVMALTSVGGEALIITGVCVD